MSDLTEMEKYNILGILAKIVSIPSIIGSAIILYRFLRSDSNLRSNLSERILCYMSALDFICGWTFFAGPWVFGNSTLCAIQGFFVELSVSGPLWNFAHTTNILLRVVFGFSASRANKLEPLYHLIVWGIPIFGATIGLARQSMTPVGGWCWYDATQIGLRFGSYYAWVFFCVTYSIFVAVVVLLYIRSKQRMSGFKLSKRTIRSAKRQLYYVTALVISFGPSSITRVVQSITGEQVFWLQIIQSITVPLQGFLNCVIYLVIHGVIFKEVFQYRISRPSAFSRDSYQNNLIELDDESTITNDTV